MRWLRSRLTTGGVASDWQVGKLVATTRFEPATLRPPARILRSSWCTTAFKKLLDKLLDKIIGLVVERWRAGEVERGLSNQTINRDISSISPKFKLKAVEVLDLAREAAMGGNKVLALVR